MVSMLGVLGSVMATAAPAWADPPTWAYEVHEDRLSLRLGATTVAEYVYIDPKILRPYFTRLRTPAGLLVTRQHPPVKDVDATDHDTMHPGLWLAFGDINGHDFWRNVARIKHVGLTTPEVEADRLRFAACSRLVTPQGAVIGRVESEFTCRTLAAGWALVWRATFYAIDEPLRFGDQEEMGFGVRLATPLSEQHGGRLRNADGLETAAKTWGQPAAWCAAEGIIDGRSVSLTMAPDPNNFRGSWWHNRATGLMVANPFGRAAMKQGAPSVVVVEPGQPFVLRCAAIIQEGPGMKPADAATTIFVD
jgi:hypothetical protein